MPAGVAAAGDRCILGLDVGSTTTKAALVRVEDNLMLASVYLRTNGNPVRASRQCYQGLIDRLEGVPVRIVGLGVTGSGRYIAGLHADTDTIINEIIAHATAAAYFDPEVDTIFEIGGQDAKYTYLTNGVASDYAMNEACSAGTGSFLEESAREIDGRRRWRTSPESPSRRRTRRTSPTSARPSSLRTSRRAVQEGIGREDIIAGLVYSICMNYVNRVKGYRQVGRKVFMQGGVCYNQRRPGRHGRSHRQADRRSARAGAHGRLRRSARGEDHALPRARRREELRPRRARRTGRSSTGRPSSARAERRNATASARSA